MSDPQKHCPKCEKPNIDIQVIAEVWVLTCPHCLYSGSGKDMEAALQDWDDVDNGSNGLATAFEAWRATQ